MQAFMTNANYHFILKQAMNAFYGAQNTNDEGVKNALRFSCIDKAQAVFESLEPEQEQLIGEIFHIHSEEELGHFDERLQEFLLPFPVVTDTTVKKIVPESKKN